MSILPGQCYSTTVLATNLRSLTVCRLVFNEHFPDLTSPTCQAEQADPEELKDPREATI